jgi:Protein of unknown function (DUF2867)
MSRAHVVVRQVEVPTGSAIKAALKRADFSDAYEVQLARPERTVGEAYVAIFCNAPPWVQGLMNLRGYFAVCLGLTHPFDARDVALNDGHPFEIGQRVGSFTVQSIHVNELIVGDDDKHLNFRISTIKTEREGVFYITVSTAVVIHNTLGRLYMVVVKPFHQFLAPYLVRRAASIGRL